MCKVDVLYIRVNPSVCVGLQSKGEEWERGEKHRDTDIKCGKAKL